jgi:hypothetical protein
MTCHAAGHDAAETRAAQTKRSTDGEGREIRPRSRLCRRRGAGAHLAADQLDRRCDHHRRHLDRPAAPRPAARGGHQPPDLAVQEEGDVRRRGPLRRDDVAALEGLGLEHQRHLQQLGPRHPREQRNLRARARAII